ncbi:MAG: glycosyl transferase family 1, partial [Chloroflexota bacterium]
PWFESELTYCNATLAQALLGEPEQGAALQALAWLCGVMEVDGVMSLIGNQGFYPRGGYRAVYDQQPVDAQAALAACLAAFEVSGDARFQRWARLAFGWFTGANPTHLSLIDDDSGGCADGLLEKGVNANQGAESLLAWLLAQEDVAEAGLTL